MSDSYRTGMPLLTPSLEKEKQREKEKHRKQSVVPAKEAAGRPNSLCDALDRLLNTGVVVVGDATLAVANIDLIYIQLHLVLSSVETLRKTGWTPGSACISSHTGRSAPVSEMQAESTGQRECPTGAGNEEPSLTPPEPRIIPFEDKYQKDKYQEDHSEWDADGATRPSAGSIPLDEQTGEPIEPPKSRGLAQLVLILVKLLHELLQRQAVERMEGGGLDDEETERLGLALLQQARELERIRREFGLKDEELNLDLGPLGKLF